MERIVFLAPVPGQHKDRIRRKTSIPQTCLSILAKLWRKTASGHLPGDFLFGAATRRIRNRVAELRRLESFSLLSWLQGIIYPPEKPAAVPLLMTAFGAIYSNPRLGSFNCPFVGSLWGDAEEEETWVFNQACSRLSFVSNHLLRTFLALDVQLHYNAGHLGVRYRPGTVGG